MPAFLLSRAVYPPYLHSKVAIQPVPEHHFFPYMCPQEITKVNDISPAKEQDQVLIVLSMLVWLGRTNQRRDSQKNLLVLVSLGESKLQISCASNQQSDFHEQQYASLW